METCCDEINCCCFVPAPSLVNSGTRSPAAPASGSSDGTDGSVDPFNDDRPLACGIEDVESCESCT